MLQVVN